MLRNDASRLTRELLDKHGLTEVEVVINPRLTRTFGQYKWSWLPNTRKVIELSGKLIDMNDEARVLKTIRHEVAHALTEGHKHDSVWRDKCIELGGDGVPRYSEVDTHIPEVTRSTKLYRLECARCGVTGRRYRRRMTGYTHRICGGEMLNIELQ